MAASLLASPKDRAENLMIVDLLRNDLGKHAVTGSVKTVDLFRIESFTHVHHMISEIRCRLQPDSHPIDLLLDASPGGSARCAKDTGAGLEHADDMACRGVCLGASQANGKRRVANCNWQCVTHQVTVSAGAHGSGVTVWAEAMQGSD